MMPKSTYVFSWFSKERSMAKEEKKLRSEDYGALVKKSKKFKPLDVRMSRGLFAYMKKENKRRKEGDDRENAVSVLIEMTETFSPTLYKIIRLLDWSHKNAGLLGALMSEIRKCGDPVFLNSLVDVGHKKVYSKVEQIVRHKMRLLLEQELGINQKSKKRSKNKKEAESNSVQKVFDSFADMKFLAELGIEQYIEMISGDYMDTYFKRITDTQRDEIIDRLYNWLYKYAMVFSPLYGVEFDFIDPEYIETLELEKENQEL